MYQVYRSDPTCLSWFDASGLIDEATLEVTTLGGSVLSTLDLLPAVDAPNVLFSAVPVTLVIEGYYLVVIRDADDAVLAIERLLCSSTLTADLLAGTPTTLYCAEDRLGGSINNPSVELITASTGVSAGVFEVDYDAELQRYAAIGVELPVGTYTAVWLVDGTPTYGEPILAGTRIGYATVSMRARIPTMNGTSTDPIDAANVVLSTPDGDFLAAGVTGADGGLRMQLPAGDVVATLFKAGTVFTTNNFKFQVLDPRRVTTANNFQFLTEVFEVTERVPTLGSTCLLSITLKDLEGAPTPNVEIQVEALNRPGTVEAGTWSVGRQKVFKTNQAGYASFRLRQGIEVDVSIGATGVRRIITVPSGLAAVGEVDLLSLIADGRDGFDITRTNTTTANRRTV